MISTRSQCGGLREEKEREDSSASFESVDCCVNVISILYLLIELLMPYASEGGFLP